MIRIRHNGTESTLDPASCRHLGEAIDSCVRGSESLVTKVRVNGCDLPEGFLDKLEDFPLEGIAEIEVETREPCEVAAASLESSSDYAARLVNALQETAEQLRAGRIEQGNRLYTEVMDALGVLLYAIAAAAQVLGEDAASLEGLEGELQPWFEALFEAQKTWDWLRVADYLEFEVAELVTGWRQRIEGVRRTLEGRSHAGC